jgi:hypothetical protein
MLTVLRPTLALAAGSVRVMGFGSGNNNDNNNKQLMTQHMSAILNWRIIVADWPQGSAMGSFVK